MKILQKNLEKGMKTAAVATLLVLALGEGPEGSGAHAQTTVNTNVKKVLLYDRRAVTNHNSTYQFTRQSLFRLAARYGFQLDTSQATGYVTAATLSGVDVVVFSQNDGDVLTSAGATALRNFIEVQGKGVLMIHAAGAFVPCPTSGEENLANANCRFLAQVAVRQYFHHNNDGTAASIEMDSVCAGTIPPRSLPGTVATPFNHGLCEPETKNIFTGLPRRVNSLTDEWYTFRGAPRAQGEMTFNSVVHGRVNVLVTTDETSYSEVSPSLGDHPVAWTRKMGNGLSAYNSMGHSNIYPRQDSIVEKFNWRVMRYLARDFMGCTDPAYAEYNPEASVQVLSPGFDDPSPCKNLNVAIRLGRGATIRGITATPHGIRIATPETGIYRILVLDAKGRRLYSRELTGGRDRASVEIPGLAKGVYLVRLDAPQSGSGATRIQLD